MPTNALTIPPPTPKAPARQVEQAALPAKTAKSAGDRAPHAGSGEPKFGEALQKAEGRQSGKRDGVEAKPAPEPAQDRPEAAQIEPEAVEATVPESAPIAEQLSTTTESPDEAPSTPGAGDSRSESQTAGEARVAPGPARSDGQAVSQIIADQPTGAKPEVEIKIPAPAAPPADLKPIAATETAAQQPGEPTTPQQGVTVAAPPKSAVETIGSTGTSRSASVEAPDTARGDASKQFASGSRGNEHQAEEPDVAPTGERTPAVRKAELAAAAETARPDMAPTAEVRKEGADAAILRALAGQPGVPAGGTGGGPGADGGKLKDERSGAASRAVEAALRASAPTPGTGAAGAERAAPMFTLAAPSPATSDAQGAPAMAQVRPESAALTSPTSAQEAFDAQVSRGLTAAVSQKGGIVTMRLQPEALGAVRIQMTIEQGVVQARFEAATPEARDLLNKHLETLRASLEAKGLSVDRLQVHLASPGHGGPGGQTSQNGSGAGQDAQRSWSHDATDGRSRGAFDHRPDGEDRQGGRGENRWGRAGAERWDDDGSDSGRRASVVRVGLDAIA